MVVIGLTGGIASGKSTLARLFAVKGVPVLDADEEARSVLAPGSPLLDAVQREFGSSVFNADGSLNRRAMAELIFRDPQARRSLERITHPEIMRRLRAKLEDLKESGEHPVALVVIPLLFEAGLRGEVDRVLLAWASPEEQVRRLARRDHITEESAWSRLKAQKPLAEKRALAEWVVDTEVDQDGLSEQVEAVWERIQAEASGCQGVYNRARA